MVQNPKSNPSIFTMKRVLLSLLIMSLFIGTITTKMTSDSLAMDGSQDNIITAGLGENVASVTIPFDIVFSGYNSDFLDLTYISNNVNSFIEYPFVDVLENEVTTAYMAHLNLEVTLDFTFHYTLDSYDLALDSFIDSNSIVSTTSALNLTQLNAQESTGERLSIFYEQDGQAIDGEAVENYLATNLGYTSTGTSYAIYFLNQSRFDTTDHSLEHWFEIDEEDPDSNVTADWWRLEWDNDLNPGVEYPYPCWGFQNRLFMVDPYAHQWYTQWTDTWWNEDIYEGEETYLTQDLDTYLSGIARSDPEYPAKLNEYIVDYLNDIAKDIGGRSDGLLYDEKEVSAQVLLINNESSHGYSQEDLQWIYHQEVIEEAFEYVVPKEVGNITFEDTWVELPDCPDLTQIINDNIMTAAQLGSYPWFKSNWTYLNGVGIFYAFDSIADTYFNTSKCDAIFTSWVLLLQNVSMVAQAYGEYREFTGLGGGGNVVCYKDLNRYFASDGVTPRSGLTTLLVHEIGHVLGFMHAEFTNDAEEGTGGFMRDVMSYYSEGTPYFSRFLRDSLHRTSSFVAQFRTDIAISEYRANALRDPTIIAEIDAVISAGDSAMGAMNYLDAFIEYRKLYDLAQNLELIDPTTLTPTTTQNTTLPTLLIFIPFGLFVLLKRKRKMS